MPTLASINPLANINLGGGISFFGGVGLVIVLVIVILGLIGLLIYFFSVKKQYFLRIHVFRLVGNVPTRVAVYCAKEVPFGMAGDKMWRVAPDKFFMKVFKIIKWLPVGKKQTAPNEFWYYIREDGEWINFILSDLNEISRQMGIRFVQEDMRLQRLATERLLEQRLMNKGFWEKWGATIMMIIVFLVIAICMVIIFYQWGKLLDKMAPMISTMDQGLKIIVQRCGEGIMNTTIGGQGLIPA